MKKHNYLLDGIILLILILAFIPGFIRIKTGFSYTWNWEAIPQFFFKMDEQGHIQPNLLMIGFYTTIKLSFWSSVSAIIIGTLMGILRTRKNLFSRLTGRTYIEIARNTPPLVLIFIFYFFIGNNITAALGIDEWARNLPETGKGVLSFLFSKPERFSEFLSALFTLAVYEGAYVAEPSLTGSANFGFVAKYKKGQTVPEGNTEFQFQAGGLNFHSESFDWLITAGPKAMFKGEGTINGEGLYGFQVSVIDANLTPSTDVDKFRIKIWDKDSGYFLKYCDGWDGWLEEKKPVEKGCIGAYKIKG